MGSRSNLLRTFWQQIRAPHVPDAELDARLQGVRARLPKPVFWLLGKAQSGKTSLIRAITGSTRVQIGNGFRPCTRTAQVYPFPDEEDCFLQFLDTRGLGEADYDPAEDLRFLEEQAHCLIVVVKAMDHAQRAVLAPLEQIRKAHPEWPLIVVQTALHEGYPVLRRQHPLPYAFSDPPFPPAVPQDLARSLTAQRAWFSGPGVRFVPVDFTLPQDGIHPEHYGLEALWDAIEDAVPLGLQGLLQSGGAGLSDLYFRAAQPHVISYALAAGAAAGIPLPFVDIPLIALVQAKLFHSVASIYDQPVSGARVGEVLSTLGVGFAARMGGRELFKLLPGLGSTVAAVFAAASTYALGCTLCAYFSLVRHGDVPDPVALRKLYAQEYQEARRRLGGHLGRRQ